MTDPFVPLETSERSRPVRLIGVLPQALTPYCSHCGRQGDLSLAFVSVNGWPFSSALCPGCLETMLEDVR
ncbi:MAG TPA: hypothetical protein VLS51_08530 [Propionibacteriaceae bacterium]|nr:hypothetical protein [Propionibacteriaceae bacterium]